MKQKYHQQGDFGGCDYAGMQDIVYHLEAACEMGKTLDNLLRAASVCSNPSRRMQSLADQVSIATQSLMPKVAKLGYLSELYKQEFQKVCEHSWSAPDEYETGVGGDEHGSRVVRVRLCHLCGKTE